MWGVGIQDESFRFPPTDSAIYSLVLTGSCTRYAKQGLRGLKFANSWQTTNFIAENILANF